MIEPPIVRLRLQLGNPIALDAFGRTRPALSLHSNVLYSTEARDELWVEGEVKERSCVDSAQPALSIWHA